MVSAIVVLDWNWSAGSLSQVGALTVLDGTGAYPKTLGVCGIRIGDAITAPGYAGNELVVTSLDGTLLVCSLVNGAPSSLLCKAKVDGALGAFNSILIGDFDGDGKKETWVAGSSGLLKFVEN